MKVAAAILAAIALIATAIFGVLALYDLAHSVWYYGDGYALCAVVTVSVLACLWTASALVKWLVFGGGE